MRSLLCKFFIGTAVGKTHGDTSLAFVSVCVCACARAGAVCVCVRGVLQQIKKKKKKKAPVFHCVLAARSGWRFSFATCRRALGTELERGAEQPRSDRLRVIVSKLNNQRSSTCRDNTIIHLVQKCRQRDISLLCLGSRHPTLENLLSKLAEQKRAFQVIL